MRWKIAWVLSLGLLLLLGCLGVYNGLREWGEGRTFPQHAVTFGVLLYGILGLVTAFGLFRRRRWSLGTAIAWAIPIIYVPGLAVMAYGDEGDTLGSAIAASGASTLIALGVVWTVHRTTRPQPPRSTDI